MSEGLWLELDKWIQGELKIIPAKWKIHLWIVYIKRRAGKNAGKTSFFPHCRFFNRDGEQQDEILF